MPLGAPDSLDILLIKVFHLFVPISTYVINIAIFWKKSHFCREGRHGRSNFLLHEFFRWPFQHYIVPYVPSIWMVIRGALFGAQKNCQCQESITRTCSCSFLIVLSIGCCPCRRRRQVVKWMTYICMPPLPIILTLLPGACHVSQSFFSISLRVGVGVYINDHKWHFWKIFPGTGPNRLILTRNHEMRGHSAQWVSSQITF